MASMPEDFRETIRVWSDEDLQTYINDVTWELAGMAPSEEGTADLQARRSAASAELQRRRRANA
jgi:hypothetical protein